jgi:aconitate decarboxylase
VTASGPPDITPRLCRFLADRALDDLPSEIVERTRHLLLDGLACGLVAARLPWSELAVEGTLAVDGDGDATLWGWNRTVTPMSAALLNGTFVQGFELDDFHPHGALHSASVVVPAAVAAAESRGGMRFDEFLGALALGFEVGPRVGIALGGAKVTVKGWHSGAVFGPFAAAAAAGAVFGLDAAGFESALGNAGTRAGALMAAQYKSMVKRMHHGMAAQAGLHGAALASAGFVGIENVIEHPYGGLASTMLADGDVGDLESLVADLGQHWAMLDIGIKRHACLIMLHSAVDALLAYRAEAGGDPADVIERIDRIEIGVSESVYKRTSWRMEPPGTSLGSQMNLHYASAVALLDGAVYVEQFSPASLARREIWDLMDRIDVVHSDEIDQLGRDRRFVTHLAIHGRDGTVEHLVGTPPQDRRFENADVVAKYRGLVAGLVTSERRDAIESFVLNASGDRDVNDLVRLLADEVAPAFARPGEVAP